MDLPFASRTDAGAALGDALSANFGLDEVTVVGLARGGVPVAAATATRLNVSVSALLIQKICLPDGTTVGAVAGEEHEVRVSPRNKGFLPVSHTIDSAIAAACIELDRRSVDYGDVSPSLGGRVVILVDDGIESAMTLLTALQLLRRKGPAKIIVATPVASHAMVQILENECDQVVCLAKPKPFNTIKECYVDFGPVSDDACARIIRTTNAVFNF